MGEEGGGVTERNLPVHLISISSFTVNFRPSSILYMLTKKRGGRGRGGKGQFKKNICLLREKAFGGGGTGPLMLRACVFC